MDAIKIYIGYDKREIPAVYTLADSLVRNSSKLLHITPLYLPHISHILTRERHHLQSTDFSFSRFLVPYLCDYDGWALFMDCDMLVVGDIAEVWQMRHSHYAVMCCKKIHIPQEPTKMDGRPQTVYPRKNWSSFMLFNAGHDYCKVLTPDYVNTASGKDLHRMVWATDDAIGEIPEEWNFLVGYDSDDAIPDPKNYHYTSGGPWMRGHEKCPHAAIWGENYRYLSWDE